MSVVRWREFAEHVRALEAAPDAKRVRKFGALKLAGQHVYSYDLLIGKIWVANAVIVWNETAAAYSRTTNVHVRAVRNAMFELKDYLFLPALTKDMEENPVTLLEQRWNGGKRLTHEQALDALNMSMFLGLHSNRDELMTEYLSLKTQAERDSMRGLLELASEHDN